MAVERTSNTSTKGDDVAVLRLFNLRVERLEQSGFWRRYEKALPSVIAKFAEVRFEEMGEARFEITGSVHSWLEDFSQDEIDAFVLSYRLFTQDNDQLSIRSLARIYENSWMPEEARNNFREAREHLNAHLDGLALIDFGDGPMRLRTLVDIVIYGGLAHAHPRKSKIFESWSRSGVMGFVWGEFHGYARFAVRMLRFFRDLNEAVLVDGAVDTRPPPAE
jgi:hypothetical protein